MKMNFSNMNILFNTFNLFMSLKMNDKYLCMNEVHFKSYRHLIREMRH